MRFIFLLSALFLAPFLAFAGGSQNIQIQVLGSSSSTPPSNNNSGGGGGGGGPASFIPDTQVIFKGRAYPGSAVVFLKDAQVVAKTIAGSDAIFQITLTNLSGGNYVFSVYSEDDDGIRSSLLTFPVGVTAGAIIKISGIFIAPTIATDKTEVKHGNNIKIFGKAAPSSNITIVVNSENDNFLKTKTDKNGVYLYNFNTLPLEIGQHSVKSKAAAENEITSFGKVVSFKVGDKDKATPPKSAAKSDLNNDNEINLVDFSIIAYWYKRPLPPKSVDLNTDGKIDLADFSIMAYYWTG